MEAHVQSMDQVIPVHVPPVIQEQIAKKHHVQVRHVKMEARVLYPAQDLSALVQLVTRVLHARLLHAQVLHV